MSIEKEQYVNIRTKHPQTYPAVWVYKILPGLALSIFFLAFSPLWAQESAAPGLTAHEILARLDRHEVSSGSHSVGTITITDRYGDKITGFEAWSQGSEKSLIAFTAGDEKGQKILRLKDTMYVAYPEADKPVKIQGSALRDSVAGSDLSYEDMAGDRSMALRYTPAIVGRETLAGEDCVILELKAKAPGQAYPMLRIWASTRDWAGRKVEKYSQNARLLKTQEVLELKKTGNRLQPVKILMIDHLKAKSKTVFALTILDTDVKVEPKLFSLEELLW